MCTIDLGISFSLVTSEIQHSRLRKEKPWMEIRNWQYMEQGSWHSTETSSVTVCKEYNFMLVLVIRRTLKTFQYINKNSRPLNCRLTVEQQTPDTFVTLLDNFCALSLVFLAHFVIYPLLQWPAPYTYVTWEHLAFACLSCALGLWHCGLGCLWEPDSTCTCLNRSARE